MIAKRLVLVLALLAISSLVSAARQPDGPVKHWVVLMMENRAYDHLLGYFQMDGVHLQGLTGREYNHWDSSNPNSGIIRVNNRAKDVRPLQIVNACCVSILRALLCSSMCLER